MGNRSGIEWTEATWNPVVGCSPVSEGCRNCYAAKEAVRLAGNPNEKISSMYAGTSEMRGAGEKRRAVFTGRVNLVPDRLEQPLRWRKPRKVFVNSMSDLFHVDIPQDYVRRVFEVMLEVDRHIYQVLTKRPARALRFVRENADLFPGGIVPAHIWLGTSVEDQDAADERIPHLLRTPAACRFLSCEPLLGPLSFRWTPYSHEATGETYREYLERNGSIDQYEALRKLDWVIVGGESGPRARPMHPDWARTIRDECQAAGVPFFFKQWGGWKPIDHMPEPEYDALYGPPPENDPEGHRHCRVPAVQLQYDGAEGFHVCEEGRGSMLMFRVGKKAAGRLLDGREWSEYPGRARDPG